MRFLSLIVRGFGSLASGAYPFTERTLVVEANAAGKTTLTAALRAALYGLPDDRRRRGQRAITDHEAHRPWRGEAYGLSLRLEANGEIYLIERDFARVGGSGALKVWDGAGHDVTERFLIGRGGDAVGIELAGVGPLEFDRTALAGDSAWGRFEQAEAGTLVDLLAAAVTTGPGGGTAAAALAACDEALRRYPATTLKSPGAVDTEIRNLETRIQSATRRSEELDAEQALSRDAFAHLARLQSELDRLDRQVAANRRAYLLAQCAATRRQLQQRTDLEAEIARAAERSAALGHLDGFPAARSGELATLAEQAVHAREQARFQRQRIDEKIVPRLRERQQELEEIGRPGEPQEVAELGDLLGAALERETAIGELLTQQRLLRERIEAEGESIELIGQFHAGLPRLAEADRRFLSELERVEFELAEHATRCSTEERQIREQTREWNAQARAAARWRLAGIGTAFVGVLVLLVAVIGLIETGVPNIPRIVPLAGGAGLFLAGLTVAVVGHRRARGLRRRCVLQGEERLRKLDEERAGLSQRQLVRQERLASLAPLVLGRDAAARVAADADAFLALFRRYDSFRIRHAEWFRLEDRLAVARGELIRLKVKLMRFLPATCQMEAGDPEATPLSLFQTERARRQRAAALVMDVEKLRELLAEAEREERRQLAELEQAGQRAATVLAALPAGVRYPEAGALAASAAGAGDERVPAVSPGPAAAEAPTDLVAEFLRDPRAAAQWFAARAEEATQLRRLRDETLPGLEGRLAELPSLERARELLAGLDLELARLDRESAAVGGRPADAQAGAIAASDTEASGDADVAALMATGEALRRQRATLAAELATRAREVAEIERRRRDELPALRQTLADARQQLERAVRFRESITLARDVITRLSGEVYHQWAASLETDVSRLIALLSPEIETISFTPTLDFSVTPRGGRRLAALEAERLLSGGQRDQVLLAIRLALARFLARPGQPLPLVLDDPFVRYDDERFARGMRALLTETPGHQIILLTCQHQRLEWLAAHHPDAHAGWSRLSLVA